MRVAPPRMEYALTVAGAFGGSLRSGARLRERVLRRPSRLEQFRPRLRSEPGHGARPQFGVITETDGTCTVRVPRRTCSALLGAGGCRIETFDASRADRSRTAPEDRVRIIYGNDWFVVPADARPVGSLTAINSLVVTDSLRRAPLLRPIGDRALPDAN